MLTTQIMFGDIDNYECNHYVFLSIPLLLRSTLDRTVSMQTRVHKLPLIYIRQSE